MTIDGQHNKSRQPWRSSRIKNLLWTGSLDDANEFLGFFDDGVEWRTHGAMCEARCADGERVYWWRGTGMVARVFPGQDSVPEIPHPSLAAPQSWDVLEQGPGRGMSLPEFVLRRPHVFYRELFEKRFPKAAAPTARLIGYRGQNIKLPSQLSKGHAVAYLYDFNDRYYGFEIIRSDRFPFPFRGRIYITDRVNLSLTWSSTVGSEEASTRRSFHSYYGNPGSERWPRADCENFFADSSNFV